jgi:hypothetical protein
MDSVASSEPSDKVDSPVNPCPIVQPMASTPPNQHGNCGRPKRGDDGELDEHRQQNLDRVETQPGAHVAFEVGVVHAVQPPQ